MKSPRSLLPCLLLPALACAAKNNLQAGPPPMEYPAVSAEVDAAVRTDSTAAPDGATPFPARVMGGSRLKARYARTADGEKYFLFNYYDTMLGIPCAFNVAQDGKTRCLPLPPARTQPTLYNDTGCTQALLPADDACAHGYALQTVSGRTTVFRVGPAFAPTSVFGSFTAVAPPASPDGGVADAGADGVMGGVGPGCVPVANKTGQRFFSLGDVVPPETFVGAENDHTLPQAGHRVIGTGRTAEDGSKERTHWWDTKFNQYCFIDPYQDGALRCVPSQWMVYPARYFADAACTQLLAASTLATAPAPYFVRTTDVRTCPPRATYYTTQPRPDLTTVYAMSAAGCGPVAVPPGFHFYQLGPALAPGELDEFKETRQGTGRLRRRVLMDADGNTDRLSTPFDTVTGDLCEFEPMSDGSVRCVPPTAGRNDLFSDSACQQRAGVPYRALACGVTVAQATRFEGAWCSPTVSVHALSATPVPVWLRESDGTCEATGVASYLPFEAARTSTDFADAQEVRE